MSDGHSQMQQMIRRLQKLEKLTERSAPAVAEALADEIIATAGRQEEPGGKAWKPGRSGKPVLVNVAQHLESRAVKDVVLASLSGRYARHHLGAVRGKVKRRILPSRRMTRGVTNAIKTVITGEFRRVMGGR